LAAEDPEAVVVVLPSDQHASNVPGFQAALESAVRVAREGHITTIGIVPSRAETGYGYIELGREASADSREVARFVEKPSPAKAEEYVASGRYLWNAGMFVFRAADMLEAFRTHLPFMAAGIEKVLGARAQGEAAYEQAVQAFFAEVESVSIDYGIMEKAGSLRVVPADFGWSDLGSWESAWELSDKDPSGNTAPASAVLVDAKNNLVQALGTGTTKKIIALVGVDDLCVVETDDALLILPRSRSQDVRAVVEELKKRGQTESF
jgi:mannose-1-phosphate guanylyltransferase